MELFNGKRDIAINEGETASTISASRISNKQERAEQLAKDAESKFGGGTDKPKTGKGVSFAEQPESPEGRDGMRELGSDDKGKRTLDIDKILA